MKKLLFIVAILFSITNSYSQNEYDVRKSKWGMNMQEIINSEYPLKPSKKDENLLEYNDVWIGKGHYATLEYNFKNKKLTSVDYSVITKTKIKNAVIPLSSKVGIIDYVFDAMKSKNYKYNNLDGWSILFRGSLSHKDTEGVEQCSLYFENVDKIAKLAEKLKEINVYYSLSNERNQASFCFYEFKNTETTKNWAKGNLLFTLEIKPNYKLQKEINKSAF